jgi:hypothetical protein
MSRASRPEAGLDFISEQIAKRPTPREQRPGSWMQRLSRLYRRAVDPIINASGSQPDLQPPFHPDPNPALTIPSPMTA